MKPTHIVLTDQGIGCIEAPEKPEYIESSNRYASLEQEAYNKKLEEAMKQAVLFNHSEVTAMIMGLHDGKLEKGKLYPVPKGFSIGIEDDECEDESEEYLPRGKYAILVPKQDDEFKVPFPHLIEEMRKYYEDAHIIKERESENYSEEQMIDFALWIRHNPYYRDTVVMGKQGCKELFNKYYKQSLNVTNLSENSNIKNKKD